jgi:hypothetical protein
MKQVTGWTVRAQEAGSDAAHRYMAEHGYRQHKRVIVPGLCEDVTYSKRGGRYAIGAMEYDAGAETVDFEIVRI